MPGSPAATPRDDPPGNPAFYVVVKILLLQVAVMQGLPPGNPAVCCQHEVIFALPEFDCLMFALRSSLGMCGLSNGTGAWDWTTAVQKGDLNSSVATNLTWIKDTVVDPVLVDEYYFTPGEQYGTVWLKRIV